mgnify:CR=1 FL=1
MAAVPHGSCKRDPAPSGVSLARLPARHRLCAPQARHPGLARPGVAPAFRADIGIDGDTIVAIGDLGEAEAKKTVDGTGRVVAPGFIDMHSHADLSLLVEPEAESLVRQGITTVVTGQCGQSPAPLLGDPQGLAWAVVAIPRWESFAYR